MSNLAPQLSKFIFLGYDNIIKVYRLWNPTDHKVIFIQDVIFNEKFMQMNEVQQPSKIVLIEAE